jgi:hypothetical protein
MGFFAQKKPRGFQHQWIYVDERKEKLQKMEEKAKRELGMLPPEEKTYEERIRGSFVESTTHLKRRKGRKTVSYGLLVVLLVVMLFILHYLVTGHFSF